jgi:hypothetical protein
LSVKSGPKTINHDDIETIFGHFQAIINIARTNNLDVGFNDLVVGVIYGNKSELSSYYLRINERYPVITGPDFWHRITAKTDFYFDLIDAIGEIALEVDGTQALEDTIRQLSSEIKQRFPNVGA